jgi:hypothetical protein
MWRKEKDTMRGQGMEEAKTMTNQPKSQSLLEFADRVAYVVTDLNGLIGSVVNEEVTSSDFDDDLTQLFDELAKVEAAVRELADLFWR